MGINLRDKIKNNVIPNDINNVEIIRHAFRDRIKNLDASKLQTAMQIVLPTNHGLHLIS